jgi:hypothetical protein
MCLDCVVSVVLSGFGCFLTLRLFLFCRMVFSCFGNRSLESRACFQLFDLAPIDLGRLRITREKCRLLLQKDFYFIFTKFSPCPFQKREITLKVIGGLLSSHRVYQHYLDINLNVTALLSTFRAWNSLSRLPSRETWEPESWTHEIKSSSLRR